MFVPPENRRSWQPPRPEGRRPARSDDVLLVLIGLLLMSILFAPMAGSSLLDVVPLLWRH